MENTSLKKLISTLDIKTIKELVEVEELRREIKRLSKTVRRGMFGEGGTEEEFEELRAEVNEQ